jgi:putative sterol carrier protein
VATQQSAREFFESLPARVAPDRAAQINHVYGFDLADAGRWTVDVGDDGVKVSEGLGETDVTFVTSEDVFMRIVNGEQNPTTAVMTGKMKLKGDMGAAMKLSKLF